MTEPTIRPFTAASFNQYLAEHKLMGACCPACSATYLPPRRSVRGATARRWNGLSSPVTANWPRSRRSTSAPSAMVAEGYDRNNPYVSGIVETEEGAKISARILGLDARQPDVAWIGTPLIVTFVDRGEGDTKSTVLAFSAS